MSVALTGIQFHPGQFPGVAFLSLALPSGGIVTYDPSRGPAGMRAATTADIAVLVPPIVAPVNHSIALFSSTSGVAPTFVAPVGTDGAVVTKVGTTFVTSTTLPDGLAAETSARIAADSTLQGNITSETTARQAADVTLQNNITAEAAARSSGDATNATAITSEATARQTADTTLQTNITNEANARIAGDATNATAISTEATTRGTADSTLQTNITNEANTRSSADATLTTNLATEVSTRQSSFNGSGPNSLIATGGGGGAVNYVAAGADGFYARCTGGVWSAQAGTSGGGGSGAPLAIQTFNNSGGTSYVPTAGMTKCLIKMQGAGGGGGGSFFASTTGLSGSGGGGSGAYMQAWFSAAQIGASRPMVVGAGGAGGSVGSAGSPGGATTLGASFPFLMTVGGGLGGLCEGAVATAGNPKFTGGGNGGAQPSISGGDLYGIPFAVPGNPGGSVANVFGNNIVQGGIGASSPIGSPATLPAGNVGTVAVPGPNAVGYGGGGGGGCCSPNAAAGVLGGNGAQAYVEIWEY